MNHDNKTENYRVKWDYKACTDEIVKRLNYALDHYGIPFVFAFDYEAERGDDIAMILRPYEPDEPEYIEGVDFQND